MCRNHTHRRDFLQRTFLAPLVLAEAARNAAWAKAGLQASGGKPKAQFDLEKVADGVYAAIAKPSFAVNCNAAVFVNDDDVVILDTHSKPSAAQALLAQIGEITKKPVRYIINSHLHWDHAQGNHAYHNYPRPIDIISSETTRQLLEQFGIQRLKAQIPQLPRQLDALRERIAKTTDAAELAKLKDWLAQGEAYLEELKTNEIDLPTLTFDKTLVLNCGSREIHLMFVGRAHTAGDIVAWLPKEKVMATADMTHGILPSMGDGYPLEWSPTLDRLRTFDFDHVIPGHGGVQSGKQRIVLFRNYIEELTGKVQEGIRAGKTVQELRTQITPESLRSVSADNFREKVIADLARLGLGYPNTPAEEFDSEFKGNIGEIYRRLQARS